MSIRKSKKKIRKEKKDKFAEKVSMNKLKTKMENNLKKYSGPSVIPEDTQCSEQDGQVANQQETTTSIVPANNQENQQQRRDIVPQGADFTPVAPLRRGPRLESRYNLRQTIKVNRRPDCIYF